MGNSWRGHCARRSNRLDSCEITASWRGTCQSIRCSFSTRMRPGVTGYKCRKPTRAEKSVLNAQGFGGAMEGRSLFGLGVARDAIARYGRAIVVEGEFDALGWHAAAIARGRHFELVALGGTAKPTVQKFRTLRELGARVVYLALDGDPPGEQSTALACRCAWEAGVEVGVLSMPAACKDPDEVLARYGPEVGGARLFSLDRAEAGVTWLARYQLRMGPPLTLEAAAQLRETAAEFARVMPVDVRARYAGLLAEALGTGAEALQQAWARHTAEVRVRQVRQELRAWVSQWALRLDQGALADHLAEAARVFTAAQAELADAAASSPPRPPALPHEHPPAAFSPEASASGRGPEAPAAHLAAARCADSLPSF